VAGGFWVLQKLLTRGEDLFVVPALIVFLQGPVEGSELALDNQLSYNRLAPILWARVYPLGDERSKIDSVIVMASG
jgi:hypothetical protein